MDSKVVRLLALSPHSNKVVGSFDKWQYCVDLACSLCVSGYIPGTPGASNSKQSKDMNITLTILNEQMNW